MLSRRDLCSLNVNFEPLAEDRQEATVRLEAENLRSSPTPPPHPPPPVYLSEKKMESHTPKNTTEIAKSRNIQLRQQKINISVTLFRHQSSGQASKNLINEHVEYLIDFKYLGRDLRSKRTVVSKL